MEAGNHHGSVRHNTVSHPTSNGSPLTGVKTSEHWVQIPESVQGTLNTDLCLALLMQVRLLPSMPEVVELVYTAQEKDHGRVKVPTSIEIKGNYLTVSLTFKHLKGEVMAMLAKPIEVHPSDLAERPKSALAVAVDNVMTAAEKERLMAYLEKDLPAPFVGPVQKVVPITKSVEEFPYGTEEKPKPLLNVSSDATDDSHQLYLWYHAYSGIPNNVCLLSEKDEYIRRRESSQRTKKYFGKGDSDLSLTYKTKDPVEGWDVHYLADKTQRPPTLQQLYSNSRLPKEVVRNMIKLAFRQHVERECFVKEQLAYKAKFKENQPLEQDDFYHPLDESLRLTEWLVSRSEHCDPRSPFEKVFPFGGSQHTGTAARSRTEVDEMPQYQQWLKSRSNPRHYFVTKEYPPRNLLQRKTNTYAEHLERQLWMAEPYKAINDTARLRMYLFTKPCPHKHPKLVGASYGEPTREEKLNKIREDIRASSKEYFNQHVKPSVKADDVFAEHRTNILLGNEKFKDEIKVLICEQMDEYGSLWTADLTSAFEEYADKVAQHSMKQIDAVMRSALRAIETVKTTATQKDRAWEYGDRFEADSSGLYVPKRA